ncbi:MAG TPA: type II toxin-antitoxin system VapC family toxin [Gemmataceae bacterium]|jgi:predicted nucleic acid-binding protein
MSFLIDTDTCSTHLKQKGNLTHRFLQYLGRLHVSVITVGELYTWALRSKAPPRRLQDLQDFLNDVQVLEVTEPVARRFGEVRAALFDAGMSVPEMDLMIAATALVHNLTVVTHNQQDYRNVPGLPLDDWLVP